MPPRNLITVIGESPRARDVDTNGTKGDFMTGHELQNLCGAWRCDFLLILRVVESVHSVIGTPANMSATTTGTGPAGSTEATLADVGVVFGLVPANALVGNA